MGSVRIRQGVHLTLVELCGVDCTIFSETVTMNTLASLTMQDVTTLQIHRNNTTFSDVTTVTMNTLASLAMQDVTTLQIHRNNTTFYVVT